ncbi:hypothetical protein DCO58_11510 [Helicobacter saguini]|uniref:Uncharacterized protein n=1 Tax=Helicobacter saguini TaxID=1548018 RepID=A0A347W6B0_9HELI|nr:hypothetical protein [Helicobacter saguini]MWV61084.1 hypothetical protein [Helicobacter saguini]MWV68247.1 hypothetical protein [Helicobacter saguini]MWV70289.1 hypothetical protein [Helicobacter saguini]MWV72191.1 hypothetical protein [Helicobacter saguini]TLD95245.1 hypothetical protein LS64_002470 [Helicobacter saguini]
MQEKNFFTKTESLLEKISTFSIFDKDVLQKGMKFDSNDGKDSIFFTLYVGSTLHLGVAYSYIFDERDFNKVESPRLHIIKCDSFKKISPDNIKVCVPSVNAFDYRVRVNGVDTRLFYEHPLHICEVCVSLLMRILSKKYKREMPPLKEQEILNLVFRNKLKNLIFGQ